MIIMITHGYEERAELQERSIKGARVFGIQIIAMAAPHEFPARFFFRCEKPAPN